MSAACRQFHADLPAYIERRLPPDLANACEQHWLQCPRCEAEVTRLFPEAQVRLEPEASQALWQRIAQRLPAATPQVARPRRRHIQGGLLMAAAAALLLAIAGLPAWQRAFHREAEPLSMLPPPPPPPGTTPEPAVAPQPAPDQPVAAPLTEPQATPQAASLHGPPPPPESAPPSAPAVTPRSGWRPHLARTPRASVPEGQPASQPLIEGWIPVLRESWRAPQDEPAEQPARFPLSELRQRLPIW